jgi:hypothetical protein
MDPTMINEGASTETQRATQVDTQITALSMVPPQVTKCVECIKEAEGKDQLQGECKERGFLKSSYRDDKTLPDDKEVSSKKRNER